MKTPPVTRYCAFCGLPLPPTFGVDNTTDPNELEYCCSGCRSVSDVLAAEQEDGLAAQGMLRLALAIFFTMNVMVFTMALWSRDLYPAESFENPLADSLRDVFRWASLVFSLPVIYLLGRPIAAGVWQAIRARNLTTDLLILAGVIAAYSYSVVSVLRGEGHVYFEVGAMVLVFVSLGRFLEARGKRQAGTSLDQLANLLPDTVRKLSADGTYSDLPREQIHTDDTVRVLPGERFPVDGVIVQGQALVDQQLVTGESTPVERRVGDTISSGTLNLDGDLRVLVTAADGQETISRIVDLVRTARSTKGRHERLADHIAVVFIPLVCVVALVAGWYHTRQGGIDHGILTALSVVLIACPCALGMATPMAVWSALGRAARSGLLFRSGVVLERLAKVRIACFDKTGTLTTGAPTIEDLKTLDAGTPDRSLQVAAALAHGSTHPLSVAICDFARDRKQQTPSLHEILVQSLPGRGLSADTNSLGSVYLGSRRLMQEMGLTIGEPLLSKLNQSANEQRRVYVGWQGTVHGVFEFREQLRSDAGAALAACHALGLQLHILTGDNSVQALTGHGVPLSSTQANLLPDEKATTLRELSRQGSVAMVGDGLNDAPALAMADVGVALGCGADVSRDAAGVCLLSDDVMRFPWAVGLARQTVRIIKQNLFWAFAYNTLGIGLAATGQLNPIWAAGAMALSSIIVVGNSLRLGGYPDPSPSQAPTSAASSAQTILLAAAREIPANVTAIAR